MLNICLQIHCLLWPSLQTNHLRFTNAYLHQSFLNFCTVLQGCIQDICLGCMKTVETQLKDFLLDGKYGKKSLAAEE